MNNNNNEDIDDSYLFSFKNNGIRNFYMPEKEEDINITEYSNSQENSQEISQEEYSEAEFRTNDEKNIMKEVEYIDCVMKATELESIFLDSKYIVNSENEDQDQSQDLNNLNNEISKWKRLTSELESIKEQNFGETSSTPFSHGKDFREETHSNLKLSVSSQVPFSLLKFQNNEMENISETDRINPLEINTIDRFPESNFTPIQETSENEVRT